MPKKYKIGTRGSLLALTQCTQVKNQLEELTGDQFELEVIKTEGDENTELPLWQLDGKDFFTKELDQALLSGKVDLVVHSYKDLGSERPEGIQLAAVTQRNYPEDILLYRKDLFNGDQLPSTIEVGTSSPRRMTNITSTLGEFLPGELRVVTKNLRGNVNTRIQKLLDGEYHMICLALAGIERLANSEESLLILKELVKDLSFFILPPSNFPPAASQGALGIECLSEREDQGELLQKLQQVHHLDTFEEVKRERKAFNSYGGGCHLAVGVHVKKWQDSFIHTHKGMVDDKKILVKEVELENGSNPSVELDQLTGQDFFIGLADSPNGNLFLTDQIISKPCVESSHALEKNQLAYITSSHCIEKLIKVLKEGPALGVCAAGAETMKKLWKKNIPVLFCADSHGDSEIQRFSKSKAIQCFLGIEKGPEVAVFTHEEGTSNLGQIIPSYRRETLSPIPETFKEQISKRKAFYWTSFHQYQTYISLFPEIACKQHFCGLGKTYKEFSKRNIEVKAIELSQLMNTLKN